MRIDDFSCRQCVAWFKTLNQTAQTGSSNLIKVRPLTSERADHTDTKKTEDRDKVSRQKSAS